MEPLSRVRDSGPDLRPNRTIWTRQVLNGQCVLRSRPRESIITGCWFSLASLLRVWPQVTRCDLFHNNDKVGKERMRTLLAYVFRFIQTEWTTLLFVAAIAAVYLLLRTNSTGAGSVEEFENKIRAGQPVVAEFFSNS